MIGEYVGAGEHFHTDELDWQGAGAEPSAWHIEAAYGFTLGGKDSTFALGYQGTDEALGLELPESRLLAALSVDVMKNTRLSLEFAHDEDYGEEEGGSGGASNSATLQLAVEF